MEENDKLSEAYQNSKKELQDVITGLQLQLEEHKSSEDALKTKIENLKDEVGQKSELQDRLKELKEQLAVSEAQANKQVLQLQRELELAQSISVEQVRLLNIQKKFSFVTS